MPIKTGVSHCNIIDIPKIEDRRGNLSVIEKDCTPFEIKRVYYLYDVPSDAFRGGHAHKDQSELLVALSGSFEVVLQDGTTEAPLVDGAKYDVDAYLWDVAGNESESDDANIISVDDQTYDATNPTIRKVITTLGTSSVTKKKDDPINVRVYFSESVTADNAVTITLETQGNSGVDGTAVISAWPNANNATKAIKSVSAKFTKRNMRKNTVLKLQLTVSAVSWPKRNIFSPPGVAAQTQLGRSCVGKLSWSPLEAFQKHPGFFKNYSLALTNDQCGTIIILKKTDRVLT